MANYCNSLAELTATLNDFAKVRDVGRRNTDYDRQFHIWLMAHFPEWPLEYDGDTYNQWLAFVAGFNACIQQQISPD